MSSTRPPSRRRGPGSVLGAWGVFVLGIKCHLAFLGVAGRPAKAAAAPRASVTCMSTPETGVGVLRGPMAGTRQPP